MAANFDMLRTAAASAGEPGCEDVDARWVVAYESTTSCKSSTVVPGNEGTTIGTFPVVSKQAGWFFCDRNIGSFERSPNEIIDLVVARRSPITPFTRQAVCASGAHCCAAWRCASQRISTRLITITLFIIIIIIFIINNNNNFYYYHIYIY